MVVTGVVFGGLPGLRLGLIPEISFLAVSRRLISASSTARIEERFAIIV
jgi:hypothetical protein